VSERGGAGDYSRGPRQLGFTPNQASSSTRNCNCEHRRRKRTTEKDARRTMKPSNRLFRALAAATALTLAACASTDIVKQWCNPAYTSPSFKKVMVVGVTKQASIRRSFEDEFVAQLKAAGV